jgi:hypothetical protein
MFCVRDLAGRLFQVYPLSDGFPANGGNCDNNRGIISLPSLADVGDVA